jgi:glucose dehydrogenase
MSRKQFLSISAPVLIVAGLMSIAPQVSAQVFVGTPIPQQFSGQGQPSTRNGEWPSNGVDLRFTRYSPLDQINAANFDKLEVAWRFKTDNFGSHPEYKLEGTPIMIKGVLYTTACTRRSVVALDAKTGAALPFFFALTRARGADRAAAAAAAASTAVADSV